MRKLVMLAAVAVFMMALSVAGTSHAASKMYYVCGCGADCGCNSMSAEPGKCGCGKDMVQMHLLKIEGSTAKFCTCGAGCDCKINPDDPSKCGCGKPVKTINLKGKYVCGCGPDCDCGAISDKPGKCGCGKDLKLVE